VFAKTRVVVLDWVMTARPGRCVGAPLRERSFRLLKGQFYKVHVVESPPFLSIQADAISSPIPRSGLIDTTLPLRSRAVFSGDVFATISTFEGALSTLIAAGATIVSGMPFLNAASIVSTFPIPISMAPETTPAAIAAPLESGVRVTSSPAGRKIPCHRRRVPRGRIDDWKGDVDLALGLRAQGPRRRGSGKRKGRHNHPGAFHGGSLSRTCRLMR